MIQAFKNIFPKISQEGGSGDFDSLQKNRSVVNKEDRPHKVGLENVYILGLTAGNLPVLHTIQ